MAAYIEEGKLNPAHHPTKKGFLRHFAAWILEDDLPFTTGETPGIRRLFQYLQVTYSLPSDTAVRNQLAKIYVHLHGEVVKELAVRPRLSVGSLSDHATHNHNSESSQKSHMLPTIGPPNR
jgi:hypothetical protein